MNSVSIVDYGSGNLRSVYNAVKQIINKTALCTSVKVTHDIKELNKSSHFILPGVGSFKGCLKGFYSNPGLFECLEENIIYRKKAFLGICVGMQLLAQKGFEGGESNGFGWIDGDVKLLSVNDKSIKIPHIGWNSIEFNNDHPFISFWKKNTKINLKKEINAYFVHSYIFKPKFIRNQLLKSHYGFEFSAMVGKENILGTQFHPEKSQKLGLDFLSAFINWDLDL